MKPEELKLYNKYQHIDFPNKELIYIGIDRYDTYFFLFKEKVDIIIDFYKFHGLDIKQIIKDLKLETYIHTNRSKYIKGYDSVCYVKKNLIGLKPCLKDKLKNILNR